MLAVATVFMTQPIFADIAATFSIDPSQARHAFSAASLAYSGAFFLVGPAADRFDPPKMAQTGLVALALTVLTAAHTSSFGVFILTMGATGFCAALVPASMFPHMAAIAPEGRQSIYIGLIVASATVGIVFGRVLMGVLTTTLGWRVAFHALAILLLALAAAVRLTLGQRPDSQPRRKARLSTLYGNALHLAVSPKTLPLLLGGFCLFFGFLGAVTFLTYRLVAPPFNFTAGQVGWISFAGITALIAPFAGTAADRLGLHKTLFGGLGLSLLGFLSMGTSNAVAMTAAGLLLLFLGVYTCQPLIFLLMLRHAPREAMGSASSLYILCCIGGGSLSSMLLGPIWLTWGWNGIMLTCSASLLAVLGVLLPLAVSRN
jgi:YNFM family putative membrane transporter